MSPGHLSRRNMSSGYCFRMRTLRAKATWWFLIEVEFSVLFVMSVILTKWCWCLRAPSWLWFYLNCSFRETLQATCCVYTDNENDGPPPAHNKLPSLSPYHSLHITLSISLSPYHSFSLSLILPWKAVLLPSVPALTSLSCGHTHTNTHILPLTHCLFPPPSTHTL